MSTPEPQLNQPELSGADAATPPQPALKPRYGLVRRVLRALVWSTLLSFGLLSLLAALALSWVDSARGRYWLVDLINHSDVAQVQSIEGSFWSEITIKQLKVKTADLKLELDYGVLSWEPYLLLVRDLSLPRVSLGQLTIQTAPKPPQAPPSPPPTDLTLPLGIHLDQLRIVKLDVDGVVLRDLAASVSSNGRFHRLTLSQLQLPQGQVNAKLSIEGKAPFYSGGSVQFAGVVEEQAFSAQGQLSGPLRDLQLKLQLKHAKVSAQGNVQIDAFAPYAYQMVRHGDVQLAGFNPAAWVPAAPQADLLLQANFKPTPTGVEAKIEVHNRQPGALDQQRLPLERLLAQLQVQGERLRVQELALNVPGKGHLLAQGEVEQGKMALKLQVKQLDAQALWSSQPKTALQGQLKLLGPWLSPGVQGQIEDSSRQVALQLDLGWIKPETQRRLAIRQAEVRHGASQLAAKGEFNLNAPNDFQLELAARSWNPAEWLQGIPAGRIGLQAKLKGALQPKPQLDLQYQLAESVFNGQALAGNGVLKLTPERLTQSDFWLSLGSNRLNAQGALGAAGDELDWRLELPNLAQVGFGLAGKASGQGQLRGRFAQPQLDANLQAQGVQVAGLQLEQARLQLSTSMQNNSPVNGQLNLSGLQLGETRIQQVALTLQGVLQQHQLNLSASGQHGAQAINLQLAAHGGLQNQQWQGVLDRLSGQFGLPFKLTNSPSLQLSAQRVNLGAANLQVGQSLLGLQQTQWQNGALDSSGQLQKGVLAEWLQLARLNNPRTDLILAGQWQLHYSGVLNGQFNLARQAGDLAWLEENGQRLPLTLQNLQLNGNLQMNRLNGQLQIQTQRFGSISASTQAQLDLEAGRLAQHAPLDVRLNGQLPDLSVFNPFLGGAKLQGKARLDVHRSGTLTLPVLDGVARADGLAFDDPASGAKLSDGVIELGLVGQQVKVNAFNFKGGKGSLTGSGAVDFRGGKANGGLKLTASRFTAMSRSDLFLVLSGNGALNFKDNIMDITGQFRADEADVGLPQMAGDAPKLGADVVIKGRKAERQRAEVTPFSLQVDFDLGEQFMFRGAGLDTRLQGKIRVRADAKQTLKAVGTINTEGGEYKAYGQKLAIERGILSFNGPLDNPTLDILAIRRDQAVEAGVEVRGTANSPRVSLYSEPNVPDAEKIAWLLFGHGTESMEKSDGALVLQLLNAMASNGGAGSSLTDDLLGNFGIDEVGYKSKEESDGTTTQIVTVSKRLTRNLKVGLEKSFNGLSDAVNFTLQLSRNWSIVSRIGVDDSSVDVKYTLSFD
ncbi:translocation/assembly module TamB domain-containing protein [Chitinibacter sp. ZOR0017]|uniref:translocation/assembly module TamB domain-containing protein n=1 Tax=Chitinibacter sp. ZOR0017 TaxID=1339254 RepID=UPI0006473704|nr:translocation/assembly module TamB domain-containing protein [Chitinibacter sp. ZOR0017]